MKEKAVETQLKVY